MITKQLSDKYRKDGGLLYRGTFQKVFEWRLLHGLVEDGKSSYFGTRENGPGKITYASNNLVWAASFPEMRSGDHSVANPVQGRPKDWPFSNYPLIMEINATRYRDRLIQDTNEGIAIKGPISLDDIRILYSSRDDHLDGLSLEPRIIKFMIRAPLTTVLARDDCSKEDLLSYFEKEPDETKRELYNIAYGPRERLIPISGEEENQPIMNFIRILRQKLGQS